MVQQNDSPKCPLCGADTLFPGICPDCIAIETMVPFDPSIKTNGVTGDPKPTAISVDETIAHFNNYLTQAWDDLQSQNLAANFAGYQRFAQQVVANFIVKIVLENEVHPIIAYHIMTKNIRAIIRANLQDFGKDMDI